MIRIEIEDEQKLINDYVATIAPLVTERVEAVKFCLDQLISGTATSNSPHFVQGKGAMQRLFKWLKPKLTYQDKDFEKANFNTTVEDFINNYSRVLQKLPQCLNFIDTLLANNQDSIKAILAARAADLFDLNKRMRFMLRSVGYHKGFLKCAFDYSFASSEIVQFFRGKNLVDFCPYCNREDARYELGDDGKPAETPELDHFFAKSAFPLLCYSLFNLVPSGGTCNTTNKKKTEFSDEFHLNPYIDGFGNDVWFKAIRDPGSTIVKEIDIVIDAVIGSPRRKQLDGNNLHHSNPHGNVNIFKLTKLYNKEEPKEKAKTILNALAVTIPGISSLDEFLKRMDHFKNEQDQYIGWFEDRFESVFHKKNFNSRRYAKLKRDVHDAYFREDPNNPNYEFIRKLIASD